MFTHNYIRYFHRKPPYKAYRTACCCGFPKKNYINRFADLPLHQADGTWVTAPEAREAASEVRVAEPYVPPEAPTQAAEIIIPAKPPAVMPVMMSQTPDIHAVVSAVERPANMIAEASASIAAASGRMAETTLRLAEALDKLTEDKSQDRAKRNDLLCFRQWWDLTEVTVCVGGKLVSGIPIAVEEAAMRVVNNEHSYFIPLGKVDYIRTCDGLNQCAPE